MRYGLNPLETVSESKRFVSQATAIKWARGQSTNTYTPLSEICKMNGRSLRVLKVTLVLVTVLALIIPVEDYEGHKPPVRSLLLTLFALT